MTETAVKLSAERMIEGGGPIVVLGPNGAGKTRYAAELARLNDADMIPALRNIALPQNIPMRSLPQAQQELQRHLQRRRQAPWELANEINELFGKLMAEDSSAAIRFRDRHVAGETDEPETTKLMQLQEVWLRLFPGRNITFAGHHPLVTSEYGTAHGEYPASQMSDGERVALYLAGRVLDSDKRVVVVDEPEVHFHSRLGTRFWNAMEVLRSDCRFVYVTHDLPFALSRADATFLLVMPNREPQVVELEEGIPKELAESLLAAASFSIYAERVVFCEGIEGPSLDQALYTAWFNNRETAVVPVETSSNVIRSSQAFAESTIVAGVSAVGIVDRDYWPDDFLESLPEPVFVLDVHEVENLFCLERVFKAVAEHVGRSTDEADDAFDDFSRQARARFVDDLFDKQVTERVKRRSEHEFRKALGKTTLVQDPTAFEQSLAPDAWDHSIAVIVREERERLTSAIEGSFDDFNRLFPGKVFLGLAADTLGLTRKSYCDLVVWALQGSAVDASPLLSEEVAGVLADHLPTRARPAPGHV